MTSPVEEDQNADYVVPVDAEAGRPVGSGCGMVCGNAIRLGRACH
jgi:hypothetical protein